MRYGRSRWDRRRRAGRGDRPDDPAAEPHQGHPGTSRGSELSIALDVAAHTAAIPALAVTPSVLNLIIEEALVQDGLHGRPRQHSRRPRRGGRMSSNVLIGVSIVEKRSCWSSSWRSRSRASSALVGDRQGPPAARGGALDCRVSAPEAARRLGDETQCSAAHDHVRAAGDRGPRPRSSSAK